jgi:hypothetical protein
METLAEPPMTKKLARTEIEALKRQFHSTYIAAPTMQLIVGFARLAARSDEDNNYLEWLAARAEVCIRRSNKGYRELRQAAGLDAELKSPKLRADHYSKHSAQQRGRWYETAHDIVDIAEKPDKAAAIVRGFERMMSQTKPDKRDDTCASFFIQGCKNNIFKCADELADYGGYHLR